MSLLVTYDGTQYLIPTTGEVGWSTVLTNFLADVANSAVTLTGSQSLTNKVLQLQNGSVTAPGVTFQDNDTGFYQPTAGQLAASTNGVQRLLIDASGNVTLATGNLVLTTGGITMPSGSLSLSTLTSAGLTVTGTTISFGTAAGASANITINAAANTTRAITFESASNSRWDVRTNNTTESGSNVGSDFVIDRYSDAGSLIDTPLKLTRSTGLLTLADGLSVTGGALNAPSGNVLNDIGRNVLHNGLFNIAQRGTGPFTTNGFYTLDRWFTQFTTDTLSISQIAVTDADRTAIGDEVAVNAMQATFVGSAGGSSLIDQRIESVRRLSGKTLTLSFYAKATTGTPKIGIGWGQFFGSGGSPSAGTSGTFGATTALTSTFQRFSFTISMPTTIGKTLGTTAGTDFTELLIYTSAGNGDARAGGIGQQSGTIALWGMQLEISSVDTQIEHLDARYDLANCQRFFQYHNQVIVFAAYVPSSAQSLSADFSLPVVMRAIPAVTFDTITYSNASTISLAQAFISHVRLGAASSASGPSYALANIAVSADL